MAKTRMFERAGYEIVYETLTVVIAAYYAITQTVVPIFVVLTGSSHLNGF